MLNSFAYAEIAVRYQPCVKSARSRYQLEASRVCSHTDEL